VKDCFDDNTSWQISQLLGYEQIREYEEIEAITMGSAMKEMAGGV